MQVVFTAVKRRELDNVLGIIKRFDAQAFYAVNDLQTAAAGIFPAAKSRPKGLVPIPLWLFRSAV